MADIKGNIFDIQRYAIHDGPGIRSLVFLKGCPLKCEWCSNPESQFALPEMAFFPDNCINCLKCIKACTYDAISLQDNKVVTDRKKCEGCYKSDNPIKCAKVCVTKARKQIGLYMTVDEVLKKVLSDQILYKQTGGGVTLSGGEPTYQIDFALSLLKALKENWVHTAIETCGYFKWEEFEPLLPYQDMIFYDLKIIGAEKHKEFTGGSNKIILKNLTRLKKFTDKYGIEVIIRIPIIPGITNQTENIIEICNFVSGAGFSNIEFLPYHKLGRGEYSSIGRKYKYPYLEPPSKEDIEKYYSIAKNTDLISIHL
ncbi:MAG: glycyl-radical enzyme activating protein [Actinobacteria bacterium]|nr:glycyl-radical enzyme activating protein [Actinomycetota bacterium]